MVAHVWFLPRPIMPGAAADANAQALKEVI
jgi:hypothetical protein